jgi:hypothetical protein
MSDNNFDYLLPASRKTFGIAEIADVLSVSSAHIFNLIESGDLSVIDPSVKPKTMRRLSREELIRFLVSRLPQNFNRKAKKLKPQLKKNTPPKKSHETNHSK